MLIVADTPAQFPAFFRRMSWCRPSMRNAGGVVCRVEMGNQWQLNEFCRSGTPYLKIQSDVSIVGQVPRT